MLKKSWNVLLVLALIAPVPAVAFTNAATPAMETACRAAIEKRVVKMVRRDQYSEPYQQNINAQFGIIFNFTGGDHLSPTGHVVDVTLLSKDGRYGGHRFLSTRFLLESPNRASDFTYVNCVLDDNGNVLGLELSDGHNM